MTRLVVDLELGTFGGPGGGGALLFLFDLVTVEVKVLMAGEVGLVSPDPELTSESPALCN